MPVLQEQSFDTRQKIMDVVTEMLTKSMVHGNYVTGYRKAELEADRDQAIDFWFDRPAGGAWPIVLNDDPSQFKCRDKPGYRDVPLCRFQPFFGVDADTTVIGRDYKGLLTTRATTQYFVAVKDADDVFCEIYRISTAKLRPQVEALEREWIETTNDRFVAQSAMNMQKKTEFINNSVWTKRLYASPTGEVWWQKNKRREAPKINFYLPESLKEDSFEIPSHIGLTIKRTYEKLKAEAEEATGTSRRRRR